jgi:transketolase
MSTSGPVVSESTLDALCVNALRVLAIDGVERAQSGHPGAPMENAPFGYVLWTRFLRHNPANPGWPNRDRFVLSAGHGSMLLYALLHLTGYDLPLAQLQRFRQWGSLTPGHPEYGLTPGVETTTGPLGQGLANAVGMAMAERALAARFNRPEHPLVDHFTYALCSDGDLMEGVTAEACSLAGTLKLGKLIVFYSDNHITIEGDTALSFTENVGARFLAYDWHVQYVEGHDLHGVAQALTLARRESARPSLIIARTHIGFGSPNKQDTAEAHGAPLGAEETVLTKRNYQWPTEPAFFVPDAALHRWRQCKETGARLEAEWNELFARYSENFPELAMEWRTRLRGELPDGWDADLPIFVKDMATRKASGATLNALARRLPGLIGGAADLAPSTETHIHAASSFGGHAPDGRNVHFGVREHAMGAVLNGIALSRAFIPYGATFLVFSDYMKPAIRLAALMEIRVVIVFTHDSVGLGEDGPTHQPVEHLAGLRAIPNCTVIRPADANETVEAWRVAVAHRDGPVLLVLTRQVVPTFDRSRTAPAAGLAHGAYVLSDAADGPPDLILIGTGSEVHLVLAAQAELARDGVRSRVVSMPSWELFERQSPEYRAAVLPPTVRKRLAVEAASSMGWSRYVTDEGDIIALDRFGASAPYKTLMDRFGFTVENVVRRARALLRRNESPPSA